MRFHTVLEKTKGERTRHEERSDVEPEKIMKYKLGH